jgi:hypothetical protein
MRIWFVFKALDPSAFRPACPVRVARTTAGSSEQPSRKRHVAWQVIRPVIRPPCLLKLSRRQTLSLHACGQKVGQEYGAHSWNEADSKFVSGSKTVEHSKCLRWHGLPITTETCFCVWEVADVKRWPSPSLIGRAFKAQGGGTKRRPSPPSELGGSWSVWACPR